MASTSSSDASAHHALRGVIMVLIATALFASMDATGKFLFAHYAVALVITVRYALNLALVGAIYAPREGFGFTAINRKALVWLRAISLAFASLFAGLALRLMPVAETVAILYLAPFGALLLSGPLMKERVPARGWAFAALAFFGVLLIVRPGGGLSPLGVTFALLGAAVSVIYQSFSRLLAKSESTSALMFYTALAGTGFFAAQLPWADLSALPASARDFMLFAFMGIFGTVGHLLYTAGHRHAPVSVLAPITYMHIVWATLLGWLVFAHLPDGLTLLGIALIIASGIGNALLTHLGKAAPKDETELQEA